MSRALIASLCGLILVTAGCAAPPPAAAPVTVVTVAPDDSELQFWLDLQQGVAALTPEQAREELANGPPSDSPDEMFRYALLNQHAQSYDYWIRARDAFRLLAADDSLAATQRQMAGILEVYNQQRINWFQHYLQVQGDNSDLQQQLDNAEQERQRLQEKIDTLTELEADISTRREP